MWFSRALHFHSRHYLFEGEAYVASQWATVLWYDALDRHFKHCWLLKIRHSVMHFLCFYPFFLIWKPCQGKLNMRKWVSTLHWSVVLISRVGPQMLILFFKKRGCTFRNATSLSVIVLIRGVQRVPTTLQSMMNAILSKQRFWHCHENGLVKTIQMISHNLYVSVKLTSLCWGLG